MTESREPVNQLQHLVLARLAELGEPGRPLSPRAAADRTSKVSFHTLYAIARGEHSGRLGDRTAEGLAEALDVPVARVYDAAGLPRPQGRWLWPERFDRIPVEHRRIFEEMATAYLEAERRGYDRGRRETG